MPCETRNSQDTSLTASSCSASSVPDSPNFSNGAAAISQDVVAQIVAGVKALLAVEKEQSPEHVSLPASSVHTLHVMASQ